MVVSSAASSSTIVTPRSTPNIYENNNDLMKSALMGRMMSDISRSNSPPTHVIKQGLVVMDKQGLITRTTTGTPSVASTSTTTNKRGGGTKRCDCLHLNNLWSLWYGIFGTALQAYTAYKCVKRILGYSLLNWPEDVAVPYLELNCSLGLIGAAILLLPLFLTATLFKIGNLANDGFKLGRQLSTCSKEPPREILANSGTCRLFRHGGPTAPFVHIMIAFCLLIPKLLMEARLIEAGFLSHDWIWRSDLDFLGLHKDRMVILSFMTTNSSSSGQVKRALGLSTTLGPQSLPFTSNSAVTNTVIRTLKDFIGHENHTSFENSNVETGWGSSVSVEYLNLAIALMVYSVRYPALFWSTNKCLGVIFSFQLFINGLHTLLAYTGMSILYKVQILGGWKTLPLLKHSEPTISTSFFMTTSTSVSKVSPFLLNPQVTLALYMLSTLLILSSSLVLYLYGHTRFNSFLNQERERKVITLKEGSGNSKWGYFTHCAALCVLISVGICSAPLLHDYTVLYKGSLDDITLACIVGGILHLFFWIVVWLFLTIKQTWIFKLRVTVGRATIRQARSLKLVTDIDLQRSEDLTQQPLLIIGNGRTYNISETSPKKAIMSVIQKATMGPKKSNGVTHSSSYNNRMQQQQQQQHHQQQDEDEEQIYWLRPALVTPQSSPDEAKGLCWKKSSKKHKVSFNETASTSVNHRGGSRRVAATLDEDDGDYATLRELPLPPPLSRRPENNSREDAMSEEGKLLACVQDEHVTYASASHNQDLVPPAAVDDYEDPLVTPPSSSSATAVLVHSTQQINPNGGHTPRCLRRADSGMPHDELTPRSDSLSTESSTTTSPPEIMGSNHSETSSGVHSTDSDHHHKNPQLTNQNQPQVNNHPQVNTYTQSQSTRRAASVIDLMGVPNNREEIQWKSSSLQRNTQPPQSCNNNNNNYSNIPSNMGGILENPTVESTVVIRRKTVRTLPPEVVRHPGVVVKEEPFGRATNMRMTSFMEKSDEVNQSSATLPHFPTQPMMQQNLYTSNCSTMPLPQVQALPQNQCAGGGGGTSSSGNIFPRQHTTLPTHHNGVKLFHPPSNSYVNRFKCKQEAIYGGVHRNGELYQQRYN